MPQDWTTCDAKGDSAEAPTWPWGKWVSPTSLCHVEVPHQCGTALPCPQLNKVPSAGGCITGDIHPTPAAMTGSLLAQGMAKLPPAIATTSYQIPAWTAKPSQNVAFHLQQSLLLREHPLVKDNFGYHPSRPSSALPRQSPCAHFGQGEETISCRGRFICTTADT